MMSAEKQEKIALFRFGVIAPLVVLAAVKKEPNPVEMVLRGQNFFTMI